MSRWQLHETLITLLSYSRNVRACIVVMVDHSHFGCSHFYGWLCKATCAKRSSGHPTVTPRLRPRPAPTIGKTVTTLLFDDGNVGFESFHCVRVTYALERWSVIFTWVTVAQPSARDMPVACHSVGILDTTTTSDEQMRKQFEQVCIICNLC